MTVRGTSWMVSVEQTSTAVQLHTILARACEILEQSHQLNLESGDRTDKHIECLTRLATSVEAIRHKLSIGESMKSRAKHMSIVHQEIDVDLQHGYATIVLAAAPFTCMVTSSSVLSFPFAISYILYPVGVLACFICFRRAVLFGESLEINVNTCVFESLEINLSKSMSPNFLAVTPNSEQISNSRSEIRYNIPALVVGCFLISVGSAIAASHMHRGLALKCVRTFEFPMIYLNFVGAQIALTYNHYKLLECVGRLDVTYVCVYIVSRLGICLAFSTAVCLDAFMMSVHRKIGILCLYTIILVVRYIDTRFMQTQYWLPEAYGLRGDSISARSIYCHCLVTCILFSGKLLAASIRGQLVFIRPYFSVALLRRQAKRQMSLHIASCMGCSYSDADLDVVGLARDDVQGDDELGGIAVMSATTLPQNETVPSASAAQIPIATFESMVAMEVREDEGVSLLRFLPQPTVVPTSNLRRI